MRKLVIDTPSPELVDAYLEEISKAYGVEWSPREAISSESQSKVSACVNDCLLC